jgi:hypothetical protein
VPKPPRTAFLEAAWQQIIDEDAERGGEPAWMEGWLRWARKQKQPQGGVGAALERLVAAGADPRDLTDVVRALQCDLLVNLCDVLDADGFGLFAIDATGKPRKRISSLHESVGQLDPTGRGGEPRETKTKTKTTKKKRR